MLLLPAIDLMSGEAVRLQQGDPSRKTVYSSDPPAFAREWESRGGDWLHLVDLDAAFSRGNNLEVIRAITSSVRIPCELGGGIRDQQGIERVLSAGVQRVILGTRAAESADFVAESVREFGGARIAVGIDARNGKVATHGWQEETDLMAFAFAKRMESLGVGTLIFTDIATDGMLTGPNFQAMEELCTLVDCQVIASGGVSSAGDLRRLSRIPGLYGAIIGKALYDGKIEGNLRSHVPVLPSN
jgi:phosphoribosylformimino-5-aminoimidazole carboxamide ribotide isomerase